MAFREFFLAHSNGNFVEADGSRVALSPQPIKRILWRACVVAFLAACVVGSGQQATAQKMPPIPPANPTAPPPAPPANAPATMKLSLEQAIELAITHNHALAAQRSTIDQSKALEITANLRPNPTISWDTQFLPLFSPSNFTADYFKNQAQFDLGLGYLLERGKKRQHRLQAAQDQTSVVRSQVDDDQRTTVFNVAAQFINALLAESTLTFAEEDLKSFQQTVQISEERRRAGDMSEADLLKIKLQLLQFQTDVSAARLARVQALAGLRQLMGFESVPENFEVAGELGYEPVKRSLEDLESMALRTRPDLVAAQRGVVAAQARNHWRKQTASAI